MTMELQMKRYTSYKNCLIFSESFQLSQSSSWIPRYALTRQEPNLQADASPSHHDRLDKVFGTESEADQFALEDAMHRIDEI
jgi:hypothetical protein